MVVVLWLLFLPLPFVPSPSSSSVHDEFILQTKLFLLVLQLSLVRVDWLFPARPVHLPP